MTRHSHKFTIADHDAVQTLVRKAESRSAQRVTTDHQKVLKALDDAARHYKDSNEDVRQAFFHGLLTGYAVAMKLP